MKYLDKIGLTYLWNKLKDKIPMKVSDLTNDSKFVSSDNITSILVVDELPSIEEEGVLYLVKSSEELQKINYYNQSTEKNYTSSTGINYVFGVDKTITFNSMPSADASTNSNVFTANLSTDKTYRLTFDHLSGDCVKNNSSLLNIKIYSGNDSTTGTKVLDLTFSDKNNITGTFIPVVDGNSPYVIRVGVYGQNQYNNLKFGVKIEEI